MKLGAATSLLTLVLCAASQTACAQQGDLHSGGHGAVRAACQADLDKFCSDVQGHGRFQCLREHQDQVSDGCKAALAQAQAWRQQHDSDAGAPPSGSQ